MSSRAAPSPFVIANPSAERPGPPFCHCEPFRTKDGFPFCHCEPFQRKGEAISIPVPRNRLPSAPPNRKPATRYNRHPLLRFPSVNALANQHPLARCPSVGAATGRRSCDSRSTTENPIPRRQSAGPKLSRSVLKMPDKGLMIHAEARMSTSINSPRLLACPKQPSQANSSRNSSGV